MFLYSVFAVSLIVVLFFFPFHFLFFKNKRTNNLLPPGKTGWPLIGETPEFLYNCWKGHPENFIIKRMNKHSPKAFKTHILGEPTVVLCGPNGNKFLFTNENKLVKAWWPSSFTRIFEPDTRTNLADEARKLKKIPHILKPDVLKIQVSAIDDVARRHFSNAWEGKNQASVHPLATDYTLNIACRIFLSVEEPERVRRLAEPLHCLASGVLSIPIDFPGTQFNRALKAAKIVRSELGSIVSQRRLGLNEGKLSPTQDIMSQMIVASDEDGRVFKHDLEIVNKIMGFIVAGRDTTSIACTFVVKFLAELPQVYDRVYQEQMEIASSKAAGELLNWDDLQKMRYSWNVACEVMRLTPPAHGTFREAAVDFEYQGFLIPKGYKLHWSAYTTHLDPKYFPEPLKFDPSRFDGSGPEPYTYVPFGGGPRMCAGREYARVEILVFMHHLVRRFKWDKIIPDEKIIVNPLPVPSKGLPIRLFPHNKH